MAAGSLTVTSSAVCDRLPLIRSAFGRVCFSCSWLEYFHPDLYLLYNLKLFWFPILAPNIKFSVYTVSVCILRLRPYTLSAYLFS